jgi:hypothetical protein
MMHPANTPSIISIGNFDSFLQNPWAQSFRFATSIISWRKLLSHLSPPMTSRSSAKSVLLSFGAPRVNYLTLNNDLIVSKSSSSMYYLKPFSSDVVSMSPGRVPILPFSANNILSACVLLSVSNCLLFL